MYAALLSRFALRSQSMSDPVGDGLGPSRLIVTAASQPYFDSLLALLGSLRVNWPAHPPVLVYDLGLDAAALQILRELGQSVRVVEPFCPHWRRHFAWKIWCWNDAPAEEVLWIDAGIVVLAPLDEIFSHLKQVGYFVVPTYHLLSENASEAACEGCGVSSDFREGRWTFAGGFIGFRKHGRVLSILHEALEIAKVERFIASSDRAHRHDQMLVSLLLHRDMGQVCPGDGLIYAGWLGPNQVPGQRVWVHRRKIHPKDLEHLMAAAASGGPSFQPRAPLQPSWVRRSWKATFAAPERWLRRLVRGQPLRDRKPYDGVRTR